MQMKKCSKCNEIKEHNQFYKYKSSNDGFTVHCKKCMTEHKKQYNEVNKEKIKEKNRLDRLNNPDKYKPSKVELTQELLKELLHYDTGTGVFTWKPRPFSMFKEEMYFKAWNTKFLGKEAGGVHKSLSMVYRDIEIHGKTYKCHRLAYLYMNGKWPKQDIDCIDGDYTNLKWENIREATRQDTAYKTTKASGKRNKDKLIGSHLHNNGKYQSSIGINGKNKYLGIFNTPEETHQAYVEAKRQISPEFNML